MFEDVCQEGAKKDELKFIKLTNTGGEACLPFFSI